MDEEYDVVVLGTGLTECIISGLLSVNGKKVLHMDRNEYYGGECASLSLDQAWTHFKLQGKPEEKALGASRQYNIDLVPKFLMASGLLVKILLHTKVTSYLEFKSVDGSYVLKGGVKKPGENIHKVPATEKEALSTSLMGFFETKRLGDFLMFVRDWKETEEKTYKGIKPNSSSKELLAKFKLEGGVVDVVGHALALYPDENWLDKPAKETIGRIMLYAESLSQYGKSPYLYPVYGLGDLPQAFARLSAVHGGTYMLNKPIVGFTFDETGRVNGVKSDDGVAKCKKVVGDPSYFSDRVKKIGTVGRCIAILDHPIPGTNNSESCQIILPMSQIGRKSDVYLSCVSFAHNVAPKGKYIALVATQLEKDNPQEELASGVKLLGPTLQTFYSITPLLEPSHDAAKEHIHISKSYDSSTHFESVCTDVIRLYQEITGEKDVSYIFVSKEKEDE